MRTKRKKLYTIGDYFRTTFGQNVYKVPVGLSGFTCPNIDGTVARGGCTFCENDSFSPNLASNKERLFIHPSDQSNPLLERQIKEIDFQYRVTRERLEGKFKAHKFLIYFQSFSNTYAPLKTLDRLYRHALTLPDVLGLSIGTRSDCMTDEILALLVELAQTHEIWVEYGIQSVFDETLEKINRGHSFDNVAYWIQKTKDAGLKVCGHLIFGLPDEDEEMMLTTVQRAVDLGIDSIKIHPLYVVKNTLLANDYKAGKFEPISEKRYLSVLSKALDILPRSIAIQRLTAGIDNQTLLAPEWCRDKNHQRKAIERMLAKKGLSLNNL